MTATAGSRFGVVANCSMLFTEHAIADRAAAAADAGFDAVEFWWPFSSPRPAAAEVDGFTAAIRRSGTRLWAMNAFLPSPVGPGSPGTVGSRDLMEADQVLAAVATCLRPRFSNVQLEGSDMAGHASAASLDRAVSLRRVLEPLGTRVVVEPLSGADGYPVSTAAEAMRLARAIGGRSGVLADLYHLSQNGADVDAIVRESAGVIAHVQLADAPGRHEPGSGILPIARWLRLLQDGGYRGRVALEYEPAGSTTDSLRKLPGFLRPG